MIETAGGRGGAASDRRDVRLPEHRDERPHARDARHRPLRRTARRRRTTRACCATIATRRRRGAGGRDPARGLRRGRLGPADACRCSSASGVDELSVGAARVRRRPRLDPRRARPRPRRAASVAARRALATATRTPDGASAALAPRRSTRAAASLRSRGRDAVAQRVECRVGVARRSAVRRSSVPPFAPSASTDSRLFASASRSPAATWMLRVEAHRRRARSRPPAGRAGPRRRAASRRAPQSLPAPRAPPPPLGRHRRAACPPTRSPRLRPRPRRSARRRAARGRSPCRSSTWRTVRIALPRSPRTTTPAPLVRRADRRAHAVLVGAEPAVGQRRRRARCAPRGRPSARRDRRALAASSELCDTTTIPTTPTSSA